MSGRPGVALIAAGVAAGVLANQWALETLVAERADPAGSWISDLGARSESTGALFSALDTASGVALCLVGIGLWRRIGGRSRVLHWGVIALLVTGAGYVLDGALPLSCAESLGSSCTLRYDVVDILHGTESFVSLSTTTAAFVLLAVGLRREPDLRRLGTVTLVAGVVWVLLDLLMGAKFVISALDGEEGTFQRASQVVLGAWVIVLAAGVAAAMPRAAPAT